MTDQACVDQINCVVVAKSSELQYFTFRSPGLGSGTQQKVEKRGEKERSEQTGEEGPRRAQHCSLQRRGPARGRAKEAAGLLPDPLLTNLSSADICLNPNKVWVKNFVNVMFC